MDKPLAASTFNKVLAFGLAMTLVVWTFGVFFVTSAQAVEQHADGTLVISGQTVYKIDAGTRKGFPSANVFLSQGYSWSQIVPANSADLALSQGSNLALADGTLVNDGGTVYVVAGNQKRGFTTASVFTGLGYKWSNVITDSLSSYTQGANFDSTTAAHPVGTLVNNNGTIWQVGSSSRMGIPTAAVFQSWGFDWGKVVPANSADMAVSAGSNLGYRTGSVINDGGTIYAISSASAKKGFPTASCFLDMGFVWSMVIGGSTSGYTAEANYCPGTGDTGGTGGGTGSLSVSLASDTPASGIVIKNSARAPFTKIALTANGGDVTVDSWVVKRVGVAQDNNFSSVDIVDLSTNSALNDSGKTFSSEHTANFTENLTIPSGTTKYVMLAGNMGSGNSGETPALALQSLTLVGTGSVSGTFPITGNAMTINTSITIGTATVSRGAYSNATSTALEVGKTGYAFLSFSVQAGSTEDITFSQVKVYQVGTASFSSDLKNLKLYKDGTFLADGVVSANNSSYMNFNFTADKITKGQTSQYQIKGDVVSGSARTVQLAIYRAADMLATGTTYNANITPTFSGTGSSTGNPVLTDNQATISNGTLRVGRSNTVATGNIAVGSDQVLGAFEFEVKGEPIIISAVTVAINTSTSATLTSDALRAVKIVDKDGKTVAGPTDVTFSAAVKQVAFTDTFTAPVALNVYKVVGTLSSSGNWTNNDTIYVSINTPGSKITAKGDTTGQSITATPASEISATTQTVKASNLTVTKNSTPTNKNVIVNSTGVLAGSWTFDATDSGEDVRITSIAVRASTTAKLNNLTLKEVQSAGGTVVKALSPVNNAVSSASANTTSTFALSDPVIVTKGTSKVVDLYADVPSNSNAGEVDAFGCNSGCLTAYGVSTGNTATVTYTNNDGALLTVVATGTLSVNTDPSVSTRQAVFGTTGVILSEVRFKATSEDADISKLTVSVVNGALTSANTGTYYEQIKKIYLKLDGAVVGDVNGYSLGAANKVIDLNPSMRIPEGTTGKKLVVTGDLVDIGTNQPGTANISLKVGLGNAASASASVTTSFKAVGVGSNTVISPTYTDSTGSPMILHKAVPSVVLTTPTNKLSANAILHEAKISAVGLSGGNVGIYRLSYDTNTSSGLTLSNGYIKLANDLGGITAGSQLSATQSSGTYLANAYDAWDMAISSAQSHGKNFLVIPVGSTATIDFYATVTGMTTTVSDSVSTSLLGDQASSTVATDHGIGAPANHFAAIAAAATYTWGNFVWSDLNTDDSQSTGLTGQEWYNGYYVNGLGTTATSTWQTVTD